METGGGTEGDRATSGSDGPQSPAGGRESPAGPESPAGAPQSPAGPQSPSGGATSTYGGPVPPGGWTQSIGGGGKPAGPVPGALAGWGTRLLATIVDGLIVGIPAIVLVGVFGIGFASSDSDAGIVALFAGAFVTVLVFAVISFLYAPILMMRQGGANGQTWGKQLLGIRVVKTDGTPMDFGWSALREVVIKNLGIGILSSFTFGLAWLINYLWPLWDDRNRALHDMAVQTLVVKG